MVFFVKNGFLMKSKFCKKCQITRPPESHHCQSCDNCVERFDHHCPFFGKCIGKNNYKYFFLFIFSINILSFLIFGVCLYNLIQNVRKTIDIVLNDKDPSNDLRKVPISLVSSVLSMFLMIFVSITMVFTVFLLIYHSYLSLNNITTKEEVLKKGFFIREYYKISIFKNFRSKLFSHYFFSSFNELYSSFKLDKDNDIKNQTVFESNILNNQNHSISSDHAKNNIFDEITGRISRCKTTKNKFVNRIFSGITDEIQRNKDLDIAQSIKIKKLLESDDIRLIFNEKKLEKLARRSHTETNGFLTFSFLNNNNQNQNKIKSPSDLNPNIEEEKD